jgi:hypothetical protein
MVEKELSQRSGAEAPFFRRESFSAPLNRLRKKDGFAQTSAQGLTTELI